MGPEITDRSIRSYDWRLLKFIWRFIRPYQGIFWLSLLLMPLNTLFVRTTLDDPALVEYDNFVGVADG